MGENLDYILARINDHFNNTFSLRKYRYGEADIARLPLEEVRGKDIKDLCSRLNASKCLTWDGDRVFGYQGPEIAEGLNVIINPTRTGDVSAFIEGQPSD